MACYVRSSHDFFALEYFNLGKREAMLPSSLLLLVAERVPEIRFSGMYLQSAKKWVFKAS